MGMGCGLVAGLGGDFADTMLAQHTLGLHIGLKAQEAQGDGRRADHDALGEGWGFVGAEGDVGTGNGVFHDVLCGLVFAVG